MFLGRSTVQWTALISAAVSTLQVLIITAVPTLDPVQVATILGVVGAFIGVLIAFIANTSTTPISDPRLQVGTMVGATNQQGVVIGHVQVPQPSPPPVVESDAAADAAAEGDA